MPPAAQIPFPCCHFQPKEAWQPCCITKMDQDEVLCFQIWIKIHNYSVKSLWLILWRVFFWKLPLWIAASWTCLAKSVINSSWHLKPCFWWWYTQQCYYYGRTSTVLWSRTNTKNLSLIFNSEGAKQNFHQIKPSVEQTLLFRESGMRQFQANHLICPRVKLDRSVFEMKYVPLRPDLDANWKSRPI